MVKDIFGGRGGSITSYDFTDIIAGTGIQTFYAGSVVSGQNLAYVIRDSPFYSQTITSKSGVGSTSFIKRLSRTFDLDFNSLRIINGKILVNIPMGMNMLSNQTGTAHKVGCEIWIYRVDVSNNETFLVSGMTIPFQVSSTNSVADQEAYSMMTCVPLSLTNEVFTKGQKLRMRIDVYAARGATAEMLAGIGHDPQNREDINEYLPIVTNTNGPIIQNITEGIPNLNRFATDTNLLLSVPFKLEVEV